MTQAEAITAFVALFVVIDPIGLAPLFIALTRGAAPRARFIIGARAVGSGCGTLATVRPRG